MRPRSPGGTCRGVRMSEWRKKEGSRRCSSVPWGTKGHRTLRTYSSLLRIPPHPSVTQGAQRAPGTCLSLPLLEMLLDLPELEPLSSAQGIQEFLLPSVLLPYRAQVLFFFFKLCMYVWGRYIYINTYMSYFINIYMHRKTKNMYIKMLQVNSL